MFYANIRCKIITRNKVGRRFKSVITTDYKLSSKILPKETSVFSLVQPSGTMHLGNYLGALSCWGDLCRIKQHETQDLLFGLADLHAITVPQPQGKEFMKQKYDTLAYLIAFGVDPAKCKLYMQSDVREHAELAWYLSTITNISSLSRMTQWKAKSAGEKNKATDFSNSSSSLGLFSYPVLQAADVLIFKSEYVPVGEDQVQHLELTREIAEKFNKQFNCDVFKIPKVLLTPTKKIYNLKNSEKKMSKSDPRPGAVLYLSESNEDIRKKIKKATTDSITDKAFRFDPKERPGISNFINILAGIEKKSINEVEVDLENLRSHSDFKQYVGDKLIDWIEEPREKYLELSSNPDYLIQVALEGKIHAQKKAQETLRQVREVMGFSNF
ncbi:hypothetical protein QEN19_002216 [Hanseniaspora menglaensis]